MNNYLPKRAFILAAGLGTRLRPYTDTMPKPMVGIAGTPILGHSLNALEEMGIEDVTINTHYKAEVINEYIATRQSLNITLSHEEDLLETGGGLKKALQTMQGEAFYIINGDALWQDQDLSEGALQALAAAWDESKMDVLLLCIDKCNMPAEAASGDYNINADGAACRQKDKSGSHMFTGIRICHPRIFEGAPDGAFSFLELMDKAEQTGRLYAIPYSGIWHHISTGDDLRRVNQLYLEAEGRHAG